MKKKEVIKERFTVIEGNPSREDRINALFSKKIIKVTDNRTMFYKLDKYDRLAFSYSGHPSSFHPYQDGYDYTHVLDDYESMSGAKKKIEILDLERENHANGRCV